MNKLYTLISILLVIGCSDNTGPTVNQDIETDITKQIKSAYYWCELTQDLAIYTDYLPSMLHYCYETMTLEEYMNNSFFHYECMNTGLCNYNNTRNPTRRPDE